MPEPAPTPILRRLPAVALIALTLLGAALVAAPTAGARLPGGFVGISSEDVVGGSDFYRAQQLSRQHAVGVRLIRMNFQWSSIETRKGHYSFGFYDHMVAAAANRGIRIMPVLYDPPRFRSKAPRRGAKRGVYPPRSSAAMGRFARALVRRYGSKGSLWKRRGVRKLPIRSWQVWNEPTLPVYWRPRPSARSYGRLLRTVSRYIRRSDRHAEVVTAGIPPSKLKSAIPYTRFIRGMSRAGARFNTLAINAYARNNRELSRTVRAARRALRRSGRSRARLWITELGWASGGPRHRFNVGAAKQASLIRSSFGWIKHHRKRYKLRGVVYFQWKDQAPYIGKDMWGLHTGLLNRDGVAKPALFAFAAAAKALRK